MKKIVFAVILGLFCCSYGHAKPKKNSKIRFYDFSDQLIDGKLRKPSTLYIESRKRAKFHRLLSLKKSFRQALIDSAKDPAFLR